MILVDSSVWIDYFNCAVNPQSEKLDRFLDTELLAIGDLILAEVLQGFSANREFNTAKALLTSLTMVELCGHQIAIQAAENLRILRAAGVTVRKTIDCIIATRCIAGGYDLLHNDRDFDPFVRHLRLRVIS